MLQVLLAVVFKSVLAQAVERDATQVTRGDDSVGINIIEKQRHARADYLGNRLHDGFVDLKQQNEVGRKSTRGTD